MNVLNKLLSFVQGSNNHRTCLYLITRTVREGIHIRASVPNKYEYTCYTINTDQPIQKELYDLFVEKMVHCANDDKYILDDYSIVTDDAEKKILTYRKKEQIGSFIHIVDTDLKNSLELPHVDDLANIADSLWAYIIEINLNGRMMCGLRKMSPSKVLVSEKGKSISAMFQINEKSLVLSNEQSIVFDKELDAIYADDTFFIIQKNNFEKIVGLESEYREVAISVAENIQNSPQIILNFDIINEIENRNRFIRRLAKIKDEINNIDAERITKMGTTAASFNLPFVVKSGKIIIDDEKRLDIVIKLLDDYYLSSQQTGKQYEASVKKEIQRKT